MCDIFWEMVEPMAQFTSHEAAARDAQSLPVMLPGKLIGRDITLAQVYRQIKENKAVLLYGVAGIGKTALAATLAAAFTEQPGGVLWMNVSDSPLEELLVRVGRAYNIPEIANSENPLGMVGAVASTLTRYKPLIVLDGKLNEDATAQFIERCAVGLPAILINDENLIGPWTALGLNRLEPAHALALYKQAAAIDHANSDADITALVNVLNQIPFAVVVAAGAARGGKQTPAEYLAALPPAPPSTGGVNTQLLALTGSFRALDSGLQGIMLMLGATFGGGASAELLSVSSGAPVETIQQAMNILAGRHLVERTTRYGMPFYRLHAITYAFAQSWLRGSQKLPVLQTQMRDKLLEYARTHAAASTKESFDHLAAEMDAFIAAAAWAVENGDRTTANQFAAIPLQAGEFVSERGYRYEVMRLRSTAAGVPINQLIDESDVTSGESEPVGRVVPEPPRIEMPSIANARAALFEKEDEEFDEDEELDDEDELDAPDFLQNLIDDEEDDEALDDEFADLLQAAAPPDPAAALASGDLAALRAALVQARQQDNIPQQIALLEATARSQLAQKMENEAIATYTEALNLYEDSGEKTGMLRTLGTLATLTAETENLQAAVLHATRGVNIAEQLGDTAARARLLGVLGDVRQQLGESDEAVRTFTQAIELSRTANDTASEAAILYKLGYAQLDNNRADDAITTWENALDLFRAQGNRSYEGRVLGGLGSAYADLERWTEAINFHTSALHIAREVKDREEEGLQLGNLGFASVKASQLGQAVLRYRQALHLAYQSEDRDNIVSIIVDMVRLLSQSRKHLDLARMLLEDALRLEPSDRDVEKLKEKLAADKAQAEADGIIQLPVGGTAREYASKAYDLLEQ